jgi:hypothetical protein
VECPHWDGVMRVDSACYYCLKVGSGLIRANGRRSSSILTDAQRRWIGWVDLEETGQTVFVEVQDVFSHLLRTLPVEAWEVRAVPNWEKAPELRSDPLTLT